MSRIPTSRSGGLSIEFVLTAEDLKKLHSVFTSFGDKESVTYEVECADGLTRELDFKKLSEYENPPRKAIRSIKIRARRKDDYGRYATLDFGGSWSWPVHLYLSGPESGVETLNDAIMDILAGMRPWYWRLTRFSFFGALLVFILCSSSLSAVLGIILVYGVGVDNAGPNVTLVPLFSVVFGLGAILVLIAMGLDKFKGRVFPQITFAIGQGVRRHATMELVRWVVVVALFVGTMASLIAGIMLLPFAHA
jgi:hypothetical protein